MDLRSKFTENFNKILAASSHSQADLARYMGVATATTTDWKKGRIVPRIGNINKIATFFGVSPQALLGTEELPELKPASTDILDALFHDDPKFLTKIRNISLDGKINEPGVIAQLSTRQKERIKDIIRMTYDEAVRNGGSAVTYTLPKP